MLLTMAEKLKRYSVMLILESLLKLTTVNKIKKNAACVVTSKRRIGNLNG